MTSKFRFGLRELGREPASRSSGLESISKRETLAPPSALHVGADPRRCAAWQGGGMPPRLGTVNERDFSGPAPTKPHAVTPFPAATSVLGRSRAAELAPRDPVAAELAKPVWRRICELCDPGGPRASTAMSPRFSSNTVRAPAARSSVICLPDRHAAAWSGAAGLPNGIPLRLLGPFRTAVPGAIGAPIEPFPPTQQAKKA